jgi:hypothetical protein
MTNTLLNNGGVELRDAELSGRQVPGHPGSCDAGGASGRPGACGTSGA